MRKIGIITFIVVGMLIYRFLIILTHIFPPLKSQIFPAIWVSDWRNFWIGLVRFTQREWHHVAQRGKVAPDTRILTTDGKTKLNILDLIKDGRPLVVNFGSCS